MPVGDLALARADGSYARLLDRLQRTRLCAIDDVGLASLSETERRDLLEVLESRYGRQATLVSSRLPLDQPRRQRSLRSDSVDCFRQTVLRAAAPAIVPAPVCQLC